MARNRAPAAPRTEIPEFELAQLEVGTQVRDWEAPRGRGMTTETRVAIGWLTASAERGDGDSGQVLSVRVPVEHMKNVVLGIRRAANSLGCGARVQTFDDGDGTVLVQFNARPRRARKPNKSDLID